VGERVKRLASVGIPYLAGNAIGLENCEDSVKVIANEAYAVKSALPDTALEVSLEILLLQTAPL
jgi:hypothetical protein